MRVDNNNNIGGSQLNTLQPGTSGQAQTVQQPVGQQVQQNLFGRPRPPVLDASSYPDLSALLRALDKYRRKLARLAGDSDKDYELVLAEDTIAAVDEHGTIFFGASFLAAYADEPEVLVGVLAHEIGHRPKRWQQARYQVMRNLSQSEMQALCRHEEALADIFAGKGLAELGFSCEPLAKFLELVQIHPHPEYLPTADRMALIRDAHAGRAYSADSRRKIFPDYHRHVSAKGYIGEF